MSKDQTEFDGAGTEFDSVSLISLRDMLDAVADDLVAQGSPMVRLYAGELAVALDKMLEGGR